ncbi:VTT domain-containing protein [Irregularibacter muris]|uniref:TVP38/TMEM64 family membrane protein n=1 Tax=Irregularibacter muris TaxID=1796619 RepID=A0AAE3HF73_9FIRM|nr:VTT domain-containing protein [Irregularibacter muris]MCR1899457.1 VTT domain-containing protein [Irregularibacter muris]
MKKQNIVGILLILCILAVIIYFILSPSAFYSLKEILLNVDELKEYIQNFGIWGPIMIIFIQIIQVIIAPIPGSITALAAGAVYGVIKGFLLNALGIILGSVIAFYLARLFGKPLVIRLIGEKSYNKYINMVSERYTVGLLILFFLPFFPDDALCLLAGISPMPIAVFLFLVVIGRLPGMFVSTLVGSGALTLSLPIWIAVGMLSIMTIYLSMKYNEKIEHFVYRNVERQKARIEKRRKTIHRKMEKRTRKRRK